MSSFTYTISSFIQFADAMTFFTDQPSYLITAPRKKKKDRKRPDFRFCRESFQEAFIEKGGLCMNDISHLVYLNITEKLPLYLTHQ